MRSGLTGVVAAVGAALVVGALFVGTAGAQTPVTTPGGFHGAVMAKAAAILGVPQAKLTDALVQGHSQALDDAVKAGQLTQAQADWMKQHHQLMQQNGGFGMMGGGMGYGRGMMGGRGGYGPPWAGTPAPTR